MAKECEYTEEQVDKMLEAVTTKIGEIRMTAGSGVESNRKVRVCRTMKASELCAYSNQARSQMLCTGMVVNLIADFVLRETIQRLKADGLFKHEVKKTCNELQGIISSWKTDMKQLLDGKYEPMEDVAIDRMGEISGEMDSLRMQIKQRMLKLGNKHAETASWVELTQQMFILSHQAVKGVVQNKHEEAGDDFYLEQQITMLPSSLKDSPAVSFSYCVKVGDMINFREFFTTLADELRGRNIVLQPC